MFEKVKTELARGLRLKDDSVITAEARIREDLGADSLDVMQLLMTLEEEYGVVIPDEELAAFRTVGDVVAYVEAHNG